MSAKDKWNSKLPSIKEWQDKTRSKIAAGNLIDIAMKAAEGEIELTNSRATIIKTLLDRVLPAQTESSIEQTTSTKADFSELKHAIQTNPAIKQMLMDMVAGKPEDRPEQTH